MCAEGGIYSQDICTRIIKCEIDLILVGKIGLARNVGGSFTSVHSATIEMVGKAPLTCLGL